MMIQEGLGSPVKKPCLNGMPNFSVIRVLAVRKSRCSLTGQEATFRKGKDGWG